MTDTRSSQRVRWEAYNDGFKGFVKTPNNYGDNHMYWVGPLDPGKPIIADIYNPDNYGWLDLDIQFNTIEEAKAWCEACEATGAYK